MESEAAMKITAIHDTLDIALSYLSGTLSDVSLDGMPVKGKNTIVSLQWDCGAFRGVLARMSDNVQEVKKLYDAQDEQEIDDTVLKIEELLQGVGEVKASCLDNISINPRPIPNQPTLDAIADLLPPEDVTKRGKISSNPYSMENIARVCRGKEPIIK